MPVVGEMNLITESCFATGIRGSVKHIIGKKEPRDNGRKGQALTSHNISSLVIDTLCDQDGGQHFTVACFYFDFAVQKDQSPTSTMGALLKQVVGGLEEIPEEISQAYQKQKKALGGRGPRLSDSVKMLQTITSKERTFICIDALDECVPEHRAKFIDSLGQILQKSPGTRIFVTGRPHVLPEITRRLAGKVTSLPISTKRDDIIRYLRSRLEEDTIPDAMDSSLEAEILKSIPEDVSEMYVETTPGKLPQACTNRYISRFLLVKLNIDVVLQETTIHRRRQRLSVMTDGLGLGDAYGSTLDRIKRQGEEKAMLGMTALMWISHVERPLKADELCHALAVEIGWPNLNTDNVPTIGTVLACSQGLLVVEKETSTVRLIHFTLQEYLQAIPNLFRAAHSAIAETCLTYLNSQQVKTFPASHSPDPRDTPFLEYSSLYWGVHAKRDSSGCTKELALKLFNDCNSHISTEILLRAENVYGVDADKFSGFSGLHCASFFGIIEIVASLVEMEGCGINHMDFSGRTPLNWAAWKGHEGVVKILLERDDINPDKPDNLGRTPLFCAASNGHEGVVKILLGRDDVNPDKPNYDGKTPLSWAAFLGHEGVVIILLGRDDVNPVKPDNYGGTPLTSAAMHGKVGVVEILLARDDVNSDKPDNYGRTPLWWAARNKHEGVMKILLERDDVNPNKQDSGGRTPLWWAACNGHEEVVKILLGRDSINPDKSDHGGRTPLRRAARRGHQGVVEILLARDDVNSDKPDNLGRTPLWWAARNRHEGVMKILLARDDVSPGKPDNDGETPLLCAALNGHEGVVKILLGRDDVNPNKPNTNGQTPLLCAALNGHQGVVEILLGRDDINPDKPDHGGRTPLRRAARCGHEGVVKTLLRRDDVNPDKPDNKSRTPLWIAASEGHNKVVKMLLAQDNVNPDKLNINGRTPLWWAARRGYKRVVKMLLARGVSPDKSDKDGQTPLFWAIKNGRKGVMALLHPPRSATPIRSLSRRHTARFSPIQRL